MSVRSKAAAQAPAQAPAAPAGFRFAFGQNAAATGASLRTVADSPYNDRQHLTPKQYQDHDGGPWNDTPKAVPQFVQVPNKWVVAPSLGAATPALAVFPKRNSDRISFAPDVHLQFATVWTPIVARFSQLFLVGKPPRARPSRPPNATPPLLTHSTPVSNTDVDKKGNMPSTDQQQVPLLAWLGQPPPSPLSQCSLPAHLLHSTGSPPSAARPTRASPRW